MSAPDILSPAFNENPYTMYKVLRDDYPVCFHAGSKSYLVSRHEDVARVFRDPVFSVKNYEVQSLPVHGRSFLMMDGRDHSVRRNAMNPFFRGPELQERMAPLIGRCARDLLRAFQGRGAVELMAEFCKPYPIYVIVAMLGLPDRDRDWMVDLHERLSAFFASVTGCDEAAQISFRARDEFRAHLYPVIAERRKNPGPDLLSLLCTVTIDGAPLSDEEICATASILFVAGGETVGRTVANLLKNLLVTQDQLARVVAERDLLERAIAETLRHSPPVQMMWRTATTDVVLHDVTIPAGSLVTCLIGSANRDERKFTAPDVFDIFRPDVDLTRTFTSTADHTTFGGGRHFCIGAVLSRIEILTAMNLLFDVLKGLHLQDGIVPADEGLHVRSPKELRLTFRT